jgi:hypothetical protein
MGHCNHSKSNLAGLCSPIGNLSNRNSPLFLFCWYIIDECQGFSLVVLQGELRGISMFIARQLDRSPFSFGSMANKDSWDIV